MGNITKPKKAPNRNNANHLNRVMALVRNQQNEIVLKARLAKKFFNNSRKRLENTGVVNAEEVKVIEKLPGYMKSLLEEKRELDQIYIQLVRRQMEARQ